MRGGASETLDFGSRLSRPGAQLRRSEAKQARFIERTPLRRKHRLSRFKTQAAERAWNFAAMREFSFRGSLVTARYQRAEEGDTRMKFSHTIMTVLAASAVATTAALAAETLTEDTPKAID